MEAKTKTKFSSFVSGRLWAWLHRRTILRSHYLLCVAGELDAAQPPCYFWWWTWSNRLAFQFIIPVGRQRLIVEQNVHRQRSHCNSKKKNAIPIGQSSSMLMGTKNEQKPVLCNRSWPHTIFTNTYSTFQWWHLLWHPFWGNCSHDMYKLHADGCVINSLWLIYYSGPIQMKSPTLCQPMIFLVLTMSLVVAVCRPLPRTPISNRCLPPAVQRVIELVRHARLGFLAFAVELPDHRFVIEKERKWDREKLENWCRQTVFDGISRHIIIFIINELKLRAI